MLVGVCCVCWLLVGCLLAVANIIVYCVVLVVWCCCCVLDVACCLLCVVGVVCCLMLLMIALRSRCSSFSCVV